MSRTVETPMRRSRRLLKNGYYYYSEVEDSLDEEAEESAGGSVENFPFEPQRKIKYTKSSPSSRRMRKAARSRRAVSETPGHIPNRQYDVYRVTEEVTRTLTKTHNNHHADSRHQTTTSSMARSSAPTSQPNLHGNHLSAGKGLEVEHMYGLENDADEDHLVTCIYASGESLRANRSKFRVVQDRQLASSRVSALDSTPVQQASPLVTDTATSSNTRTAVDRRSTVYSDNEDVGLSSSEQKASTRISSASSISKTLFDTKKKGKKQSFLLISLLRGVFNFIPFLVGGLLRRGKLLYQTVARMLLLDTWFLTANSALLATGPDPIEEISIFSQLLHTMGKLVNAVLSTLLLIAAVVGVVFCISSYSPHWLEAMERSSSKPEVVVETSTFGDGISRYFGQSIWRSYSDDGSETRKEKRTPQPSFQETNEYKSLIQTVHNLESSLRSLKLNLADRDSDVKDVARTVASSNADTIKLIHRVKGEVEEEIEAKEARSRQQLEIRFEAAVNVLDNKILELQDRLNVMESNYSSNFEACHQKIDAKNFELKRELIETKDSVSDSQKEMKDFLLRLELMDQKSKLPEEKPFDYAHFESLIEKRFIEIFMLLLRAEGAQKAISDENMDSYRSLRCILAEWLDSKGYLPKEEFERYTSENLTAEIRNEVAIRVQQFASLQSQKSAPPPPTTFSIENLYSKLLASSSVTEGDVKAWIDEALETYNADRLGLADYALESSGGYVVSTRCTEHFNRNRPLVKVFGIPVMYHTNTPRTVLQPNVNPGECWAFKGHVGYIVIGLSFPIYPSSVTVEHIPRSLALSNTTSAPRDFGVYGLESTSDIDGIHLGDFRYEETGGPLQNFNIEKPAGKRRLFKFVEVRVTSNWGNPDFTCIYRIRVHGTKD